MVEFLIQSASFFTLSHSYFFHCKRLLFVLSLDDVLILNTIFVNTGANLCRDQVLDVQFLCSYMFAFP